MSCNIPKSDKKRVVIVGGGFGGLKLAQKLKKSNYQVVLVDKNNYHQFPPLIYQVASSGIEPSSIAFPFRRIFQRRKDFYLRNGFYETGCFIEDSGVEYEFLSSSKERVITENDLKKRYSCMTRNPMIKLIIKNTFNNNINFIN